MGNKINVEGFAVSDANVCTADGGFVGDVTGNITGIVGGQVTFYTAATPALSLLDRAAVLDPSSNTVFATLADGTLEGQIIRITVANIANSAKVTPATGNFTNITFTAANQYAELVWDGVFAWHVISTSGTIS